MSCYSLYAPGLGWVGNVSAPSSRDAAAGWYARRPDRAFAPPSLEVFGPGGRSTVGRFDATVPGLDELNDLARRCGDEGPPAGRPPALVEAHERSDALCVCVYPEGHPRHAAGGVTWARRNLARHLLQTMRQGRARAARPRPAGVSIPVRLVVVRAEP